MPKVVHHLLVFKKSSVIEGFRGKARANTKGGIGMEGKEDGWKKTSSKKVAEKRKGKNRRGKEETRKT